MFLYTFPHPSPNGASVWVNSPCGMLDALLVVVVD
jgi:hypothetical protein